MHLWALVAGTAPGVGVGGGLRHVQGTCDAQSGLDKLDSVVTGRGSLKRGALQFGRGSEEAAAALRPHHTQERRRAQGIWSSGPPARTSTLPDAAPRPLPFAWLAWPRRPGVRSGAWSRGSCRARPPTVSPRRRGARVRARVRAEAENQPRTSAGGQGYDGRGPRGHPCPGAGRVDTGRARDSGAALQPPGRAGSSGGGGGESS